MSPNTILLWSISFFLSGIGLASMLRQWGSSLLIAVCIALLIATFFLFTKKKILAICAIGLVFGAAYCNWFTRWQQRSFAAPIGEATQYILLVTRVSQSGASQRVTGMLQSPHRGRVQLTLSPYPEIRYGDHVVFTALLERADPANAYLFKEGIGATARFPKEITISARGQGSRIKAALFAVRDAAQQQFKRTLSPEEATLMTGLVLGKSGGFSKEFTEKLQATGTTHIVALSGYNISVIVNALLLILCFLVNRRYAVWLAMLAVIGFVVMTGAEASVVRAALMAIIMILAEQGSRLYSVRTAIAVTALGMVLFNPAMLVFDVGFQLSFLALLGILYVAPALKALLRMGEDGGFLGWRESVVVTIAAQLAVLPVLFMHFGYVPLLAIFANVLVLVAVPYTMGLGFFIFFAGLISQHLATLLALPAKLLLQYELAVINMFAVMPVGIQINSLPVVFAVAYYVMLGVAVCVVARRRHIELPL